MRRHAAGGSADVARQQAARVRSAGTGLIELQDVAGYQVARADHVPGFDRRLRIDLTARAQLMFAGHRIEAAAIHDVELAAVDEAVGEQIAQRHAGLKRAVPIRGQPLCGKVQYGERRMRAALRRSYRRQRGERESERSYERAIEHEISSGLRETDRPIMPQRAGRG